jgi:hypothetical protein
LAIGYWLLIMRFAWLLFPPREALGYRLLAIGHSRVARRPRSSTDRTEVS